MKILILILALACISCNDSCRGISKTYERLIWMPENYQIIDCKLYEDFLTDGGKDEMFVIKINLEDIEKFVFENKLKIQPKDKDWNYSPKTFYMRMLEHEKLKIPQNINIEKSYYRFEGLDKHSLQCFLDINSGYFVGIISSD